MAKITFGEEKIRRYYVSIDLGQARDYTAVTILRRVEDTYQVKHVKRFELNTPYPDIVEYIFKVRAKPVLFNSRIIVDGTGVGRAVVDMFRAEGLSIIPITITGGNTIGGEQGYLRVPKRDLIGALVSVIQFERLEIPKDLPYIKELIHELLTFKTKITAKGNDTYESWREGDHDDIVLSLAMGIWVAEQDRKSENGVTVPGKLRIGEGCL